MPSKKFIIVFDLILQIGILILQCNRCNSYIIVFQLRIQDFPKGCRQSVSGKFFPLKLMKMNKMGRGALGLFSHFQAVWCSSLRRTRKLQLLWRSHKFQGNSPRNVTKSHCSCVHHMSSYLLSIEILWNARCNEIKVIQFEGKFILL